MSNLLDTAVEAHGGLRLWNDVSSIRVAASITGAIWFIKGKGDALKDVVLTVDTRTERLAVDFPGQNRRATFTPGRITIEQPVGTPLVARDDPETSFAGHQRETPWDDVHVTYFVGEALWTYLNTPFLYKREGFETEEIAPIDVDGEVWRRLRVTFPDYVKSLTRVQISCFGPDGLLRRHDYTVDILGGATGLNYPRTTGTSTGSWCQQSAGSTRTKATTGPCRSLCWSKSTWAKSPSLSASRQGRTRNV